MSIYKLTCSDKDLVYYGSTTYPLEDRLKNHEYDYRNKFLKGKWHTTSYKLFEVGEVKIELVEECKIIDMKNRERYYIENNNCVNMLIPGRTKKEYGKEYSQRDYVKEKARIHMRRKRENIEYKKYEKEFYEKYKTRRNELAREKITCECGVTFCKSGKWRHEKSKKHKAFISGLN
jgi:hypothetical protein